MNDAQFAVLRFLSIPASAAMVVSWLALASTLKVSDATETVAVISHGTFKGSPVAYLETVRFGEVRITCSSAPKLCDTGITPRKATITVWLQQPGVWHDLWVVAAERNGQRIVSPEDQAPHYRKHKLLWAVFALVSLVVAFVLRYFAPFKRTAQHEA